jgi:hypothetical protein
MPVSKKRDKKGRFTKHAKKQQAKRSEKRIQGIKQMLAQLDEWENTYRKQEE